MTLGMSNVSIGHIEPDNLKSRPGLLDEVDESSGATADIKKLQLPLITSGNCFMELWQGLAPHRIGCSIEEDFNLRVISLGGIIRHPAARLEVEILQIGARALAARGVINNL